MELPEIPILNITSSSVRTGVTSTEWAEMIDVSQPVPDFREKIRDMAHSFPFELDNFQKQVFFMLISIYYLFIYSGVGIITSQNSVGQKELNKGFQKLFLHLAHHLVNIED